MSESEDSSDGPISWRRIKLPEWVTELRQFAYNPVKTVTGLVATVVLGAVYDIWNIVLESVIYLYEGSEPGYSPGEGAGIADIPRMTARFLGDGFQPIASGAYQFLDAWNNALIMLSETAGPAAPFIVVVLGVGVVVLATRAAISAGTDVPVVGAILEFLGLA